MLSQKNAVENWIKLNQKLQQPVAHTFIARTARSPCWVPNKDKLVPQHIVQSLARGGAEVDTKAAPTVTSKLVHNVPDNRDEGIGPLRQLIERTEIGKLTVGSDGNVSGSSRTGLLFGISITQSCCCYSCCFFIAWKCLNWHFNYGLLCAAAPPAASAGRTVPKRNEHNRVPN